MANTEFNKLHDKTCLFSSWFETNGGTYLHVSKFLYETDDGGGIRRTVQKLF